MMGGLEVMRRHLVMLEHGLGRALGTVDAAKDELRQCEDIVNDCNAQIAVLKADISAFEAMISDSVAKQQKDAA